MEQNHESSFWKSNMRAVPGRPSPKRDLKANKSNPATSFENYQQSVSDAWTLSEDELTKEYCILTPPDESKITSQRAPKFHHKNQLPVVHKATTSVSSSSTSSLVTTTNANNNMPPQASSSSSLSTTATRSLSLDANNKPEMTPPSSSSSSSSVDHQQHNTSISTNEKPPSEYGYLFISRTIILFAEITKVFNYSRLRQRFNSYPGRPQLLKFSSMALKDEAESKVEKFSVLLEADLLNFISLKELSWSGVPRKVRNCH